MSLQVGQNVSDTVSPLDKLLLERQAECWLTLNKTLTTSAVTTALPGECLLFISGWSDSRYEGRT
jgi:hypothetical protein